jgi:hypothetical protein
VFDDIPPHWRTSGSSPRRTTVNSALCDMTRDNANPRPHSNACFRVPYGRSRVGSKTGTFYFAKNRKFLLCLDTTTVSY